MRADVGRAQMAYFVEQQLDGVLYVREEPCSSGLFMVCHMFGRNSGEDRKDGLNMRPAGGRI